MTQDPADWTHPPTDIAAPAGGGAGLPGPPDGPDAAALPSRPATPDLAAPPRSPGGAEAAPPRGSPARTDDPARAGWPTGVDIVTPPGPPAAAHRADPPGGADLRAGSVGARLAAPLQNRAGVGVADLPGWPQGAVAVPGELVLMVAVDLPLASRHARAAALPFAVEPYLAEPLADTQVVLGPEIAPRRHLALAIRHATLAQWAARAGPRARLVPDTLAVPRPATGWAVWVLGDRALVRAADGTGFALPLATLPAAWAAAGRPALAADAPLPGLAAAALPGPRTVDPGLRGVDLRQGRHAPGGDTGARTRAQVGFALALGALAACALVTVDTLALLRLADAREAAAIALLADLAPGTPPGADPAVVLERLAARDGPRAGRFLPLFARTAQAMAPQARGLAVQSLRYSAAEATLALAVEAPDLPALQRLELALREAGLAATSGAATAQAGAAQARLVVADPGPGS